MKEEKNVKEEVKEVKQEKGNKTIDKNTLSDKELRKMYGGKSTFQKVMNVVLWIILIVWMAVCLVDFYNVKQEKEPMFTFKNGTTKYSDGNVKWYLGAGYKIYKYNRSCYTAIEYGPFWSEDRSVKSERCK
jgi:hypothetical protein